MSVDKLVDSTQLDSDLTSVANAIRAKSGGSSQLAFPAGFVSEIQAIPSGGGDPQENLLKLNSNTLTSFSADISSIRAYLFYGNTNLASIDFSNITGIGTYGCYKTAITTAVFDKYVSIGNNAFRECPNLTTFVCKAGTNRLDTSTLEKCYQLKYVDVASLGSNGITPGAFYNTTRIEALIIRQSSVAYLGGAFPSSSALASTATIYVPNAVLANYQSASNWSAYSSRIVKIEGTIYETQYADGTPIS
jgi:hypothetical protein